MNFTAAVNERLANEFPPWQIEINDDGIVIALKDAKFSVYGHPAKWTYPIGYFRPNMPFEFADVGYMVEEVKLRFGNTMGLLLRHGMGMIGFLRLMRKHDRGWWERRADVGVFCVGEEVHPVSLATLLRASKSQKITLRKTRIPAQMPDGSIDEVIVASVVSRIGPAARSGLKVEHLPLPQGPKLFIDSGKEGG